MAAAETMTVTRDIDDTVKGVVKTLDGVEGQVKGIDHTVKGVDHAMKDVGHVVKGVNHMVRGVDCRVKVVDHKLGSVLTGESLDGSRIRAQRFTRLGVMETGLAIQQVSNQVNDLNRSCYSNIITADHERSISHTGNEFRKDLRKWITPPDPSVNFNAATGAHHEGTAAWCLKGNVLVDWKTSGSLFWIHGKRMYLLTILSLDATDESQLDSWLREEYSQVCPTPSSCVQSGLHHRLAR